LFLFQKRVENASEEIRVKSKKTALASLLKIRSQNAFIQNLPKKIYSRNNFVLLFLD
jgi:hypothetical protein